MNNRQYTKDEAAKRGREIYESRLKSKFEPQHIGKFLVIDIETGECEMDEDDMVVSMRAFRKNPNGSRYGMRIGSPTSGTIGNACSGDKLDFRADQFQS